MFRTFAKFGLSCAAREIKDARYFNSVATSAVRQYYYLKSSPSNYRSNFDLIKRMCSTPDRNKKYSVFDIDRTLSRETNFDVIKNFLTRGNANIEYSLNAINSHYECLKEEGERVPSVLTLGDYVELLEMEFPGQRRRFYNFLYVKEWKKKHNIQRKEVQELKRVQRSEKINELREASDSNTIIYGLWLNNMFRRFDKLTLKHVENMKVAIASQFTKPIVLDCSYSRYMTRQATMNCAFQIGLLINANRTHTEPYDVYLCNVDPDDILTKALQRLFPNLYDQNNLVTVTDKSYNDLFPQKNLVYLSPHSKNVLDNFNSEDVYIVGAFVDRGNPQPVSTSIANRENIRHASFPIDQNVVWCQGTKSLTLDTVIKIMLDWRSTGNWKTAFQNLPSRHTNPDYVNKYCQSQKKYRVKSFHGKEDDV